MKIEKTWILLILAGVLIWSFSSMSPAKQSVEAINGQPCSLDKDCPCFGTYNTTQYSGTTIQGSSATAYGIGVATCHKANTGDTMGTCDMTYCVNIESVGTWAKNNPWQWIKSNPLATSAILGILLLSLFWSKIK